MNWFWLSFADPGKRFLGVVIIEAESFPAALSKSWQLHLNPGGECRAYLLNENENLTRFKIFANRLLTTKELIENDLGVQVKPRGSL